MHPARPLFRSSILDLRSSILYPLSSTSLLPKPQSLVPLLPPMPVRENKAKQILRAGGAIYFRSVRLPEPGLCELLGYAGFYFVLIEGEDSAADAATIEARGEGG